MRTLVILSGVLMLAYVAVAMKKKGGTLVSVSEAAYILPNRSFTAVLSTYMILILPPMLSALPDAVRFVGFLTVVGLMLVAASPYFKTEDREIHYAGGVLFCLLSQTVAVVHISPLLLCWPIFGVFLLFVGKRNGIVFWAEALSAGIMTLSLIIYG